MKNNLLIALLVIIITGFSFQLACTSNPPYPRSKIIKQVTFDPLSSTVLKAEGSDNWPITWGKDDDLYTSWGDGWGFSPPMKEKYSLGVSKVIGSPELFYGVNLNTPSDSSDGGKSGPKASGLVMVDGQLLMWVRNTGNSTLAWSENLTKTWHWGFKFTTSFGCPTFLNFGKNYEGARDEYIYTYSQDGPTCYDAYDRIVLARVLKNKVTESEAYEYFERFDDKGLPVWTSDILRRGAVFEYPGHCLRIDVVYNPGLKLYFMTVGYDFTGGWGIFESSEPWGPWHSVLHTTKWDAPGTHSYRIPSKWIDSQGTTMYLVFSGLSEKGYDAFSVRKMTLTLHSTN